MQIIEELCNAHWESVIQGGLSLKLRRDLQGIRLNRKKSTPGKLVIKLVGKK